MTINDINFTTKEGQLLRAAICKLTTESQKDKTPDEVLEQCDRLSLAIEGVGYITSEPIKETETTIIKLSFEQSIRLVINTYSKENESNTPDYILSEYIINCLDAFNYATKFRDAHKGL
jgi:hypothetical protein